MSEIRSQRWVSEQRSDKIGLTLAAVLRKGYWIKKEEAGTKREAMASWTMVGIRQREEEVIRSKIYVKDSGDQIC